MAIARDFQNPNNIVEYTSEVNLIHNEYGLLNEVGLFEKKYISQPMMQFETRANQISLIPDAPRGTRHFADKGDLGKVLTYASTFHPLDSALFAHELVGRRRYGTPDQVDVESERIAEKLKAIRMAHGATLETARWHTLTTGTQYSPNGTQSGVSFYSDFGITRKELDMVLGTSTIDLLSKIQEAVADIQDRALTGDVVNSFTCYCSPEFFQKLVNHPKLASAFQFYSSTQEPLRNGFRSGRYERFVYGQVTFLAVRGGYNGQRFIPAGDAYLVGEGVPAAFQTIFTPSDKFDTVGTIAEELYVWSYRSERNDKIEFESSSSFINALMRPQLVARLYSSN